ncbi:MAG TPA: hypothetical protein VGJ02_03035 [Pyrinomonadaceae bacterium]
MIRIILLVTVVISAVLAMQECGQASNGANGNAPASANGNNNAMVENANASNGPATNPPTANADSGMTGVANGPAGAPPSGGNAPASNR